MASIQEQVYEIIQRKLSVKFQYYLFSLPNNPDLHDSPIEYLHRLIE